jgi:hypothetical protein
MPGAARNTKIRTSARRQGPIPLTLCELADGWLKGGYLGRSSVDGVTGSRGARRHEPLFIAQSPRQVIELVEIAIADADNTALTAMIDTDDQAERVG